MTEKTSVPANRPAEARRMLRSAIELAARDRPPLRAAQIEIEQLAQLLVSELVTNTIVHHLGGPRISLRVEQDSIRVEVEDLDPETRLSPVPTAPTDERGRGLAIVDAFASSWGVESRSHGKAVWFDLAF